MTIRIFEDVIFKDVYPFEDMILNDVLILLLYVNNVYFVKCRLDDLNCY